ncbi:MAG: hypothetical protein QG636_461 [Patescibacteria group bacterium]|nr:hypothetical protein [Patescibacteria group bacterium]
MARRWNSREENFYREELLELYIRKNRTIGEIALLLLVSEKTVFQRLGRLGIPTCPERKDNYLRKRKDIRIPSERSEDLAEFFGIMLGDGHVAHFQTMVTLGTKEYEYVCYVQFLMTKLFNAPATVHLDKSGYHTVYIGSRELTQWLYSEGLVPNKVAAQVDVPGWVFEKEAYMRLFLRGFFDTDGSVYKLRFGVQISFTNKSIPLLIALQSMLRRLGYRVSELSAYRIYITRRDNVERFFAEVQPMNTKHQDRYEYLTRRYPSG